MLKPIKLILLFFIVVFSLFDAHALPELLKQRLNSTYLGESREITVQLPEDYNDSDQQGYPLVLVLDADHLFGMVAGTVHYLSSWGEMPKSIVVGITKSDILKQDDYLVHKMTGMPVNTGANFFDFLEKEVLSILKDNYNLDGFVTVVGHGQAAAYLNFFLMRKNVKVNALVSIGPTTKTSMNINPIQHNLASNKSDIFYVLGVSDEKLKGNLYSRLHDMLSEVNQEYFHYQRFRYRKDGHYLMTPKAVSDAFKFIYRYYRPISFYEYKKKILPYEGSKLDYFKHRVEKSRRYYGKPLRDMISNYQAIYKAIETEHDTLQLKSLEGLAKLSIKKFPEVMFGYCFKAEYLYKIGEYKKALKAYEKAILLKHVPDFPYDKDYIIEKQREIREELLNR